MNRSPLFYPLNRGLDAEAGGIADLQTDVMRFMAILALCLVAIFALVQSIPLVSAPPEAAPPPPMPVEAAELEPAEPLLQETAPIPVIVAPVKELVIEEPSIPEPLSSSQVGFTLRFADDSALTRLVARNEVGLYAIAPEKSLRMNVNRGAFSFWPASVPNEFHEMDKLTVPDDVRAALRRAYSAQSDDLKWGVTLTSSMQEQLNTYLSDTRGGALIINADGKLRLEP